MLSSAALRRRSPVVGLVGAVLLLLLLVASPSSLLVAADDGGIAIQVLPARKECFYETIPGVGVKVFLHYMVTSGGAFDIDAEVRGPANNLVWRSDKESENRVLFKSTQAGRHAFCFSNEMSTVTSKVVAFSVLVGDGSHGSKQGAGGPAMPRDSLRQSISRIQQGLREIEEIQTYLRVREREHRATTEVANTRVLVWSALEILAIVGMGIANVYYLKKMFTTKRMV